MKKFFTSLKWYEYLLFSTFLLTTLILGLITKSAFIITFCSIIGILSVILIVKGNFVGNVLQAIFAIIYSFIAFRNQYYGEVIFHMLINLPMATLSVFTWLKNRNQQENVIKVSSIKLKEWLVLLLASIGIFIGMYFMLKAFNTANLWVSTLSLSVGTIAAYLSMRRCEYNFILYIILNAICIALWLPVVLQNVANIPTIITYFVNLSLNCFGIINWIKMKKQQKQHKEN